jgi:PadR family transcriptional regulator AphA
MAGELGDQAYAVLTIVALRGSSTAYEIERVLDQLSGEFWSAPHTQVYRECARLTKAGLLREKQERTGRRRRAYTLTKKGREMITAWVRTPTDRSMDIRDVSHLKLLASELSTTDDVRRLAQAQVSGYRRRLRTLDQIQERYASRPEFKLRIQSVAMGRAVYQAALTFWTSIANHPPKI